MKKDELYFYQQLTNFLTSYINFPKEDYTPNGLLTYTAISLGVRFLIEEGVFLGSGDMRKAAIRECNIILPDWAFEKLKE